MNKYWMEWGSQKCDWTSKHWHIQKLFNKWFPIHKIEITKGDKKCDIDKNCSQQ